jgi:hypothetical protein
VAVDIGRISWFIPGMPIIFLTTVTARLRTLQAEARSVIAALRALAGGQIVLADASGHRTVLAADRLDLAGADGAHVVAAVTPGEAYVLAATDRDGDVIRAADDD